MSASSNFTLWFEPRRVPSNAGRVLLRTTDFNLDRHFACTTNHSQEAGLFLKLDNVGPALHRVLRSQETFFTISPNSVELSELTFPDTAAAHHVLDSLAAMHDLAVSAAVREGDTNAAREPLNMGLLLARVSIAIGVITAILVTVGATRHPGGATVSAAPAGPSAAGNGILPVDLPLVPQPDRYHAAAESDLDPAGLSWLRQSGAVQAGRVPGNYSGNAGARDVAYLLVGSDGKRRVVWIAGRATKLDSEYPRVGLIARVPQSSLDSITWADNKPTGDPDGDGLLIVRDPADPASALVVYLSSGRVVSAVPADFQKIRLQ